MTDFELIKTTKRADQLQFLRFCAFLVVFWGHSSYWANGNRNILLGLEAMSFFFIISGFVTGYTAYGKEPVLSFKNIFRDFGGRLVKLYPLYFFTTVFAIILEPWFSENLAALNFEFMLPRLLQLLKNLLLLQSWPGGDSLSYNGVGWFLSTLIFLQLFNIPIGWMLNRINKKEKRLVIFSVLFAGVALITVLYCFVSDRAGLNPNYWCYAFPPSRLGEYFCGAVLGYVIRIVLCEKPEIKFNRVLFTVLEILIFINWTYVVIFTPAEWSAYISVWLIPNFIGLAVFGLGKGFLSQIFKNRFLVMLGDISFECYLLHQIIIRLFVNLNDIAHISLIGDIWAQAFCFFCTLFLAYLLHGRPLMPKIKK